MDKTTQYKWAKGQIKKQIQKHFDTVATMANVSAILKTKLPHFFWVGFYLLREDSLILGPFQGAPACMRLSIPGGVCAASIIRKKTIVVPDVHQFPGHVACDSRSKSEIVVPLFDSRGQAVGVLDVDGVNYGDFDKADRQELEDIAGLLVPIF